jgi:EAL domain-containing protein (putative c-di-GMP-specific phosphodiesterase class I)
LATPNVKHAPTAESAPQQPTAESLGWQLRAALPPLRLYSVSLYDQAGEVLWLSEGALGPDEHGFVVEALSALTDDSSSSQRERDFNDGRGAVFLAVRSPQAELVGLVMILVDAKALSTGGLAARILLPPVRAILQRLAILLRPASMTPPATPVSVPAASPAAARGEPARPLARAPSVAIAPAPPAGSATTSRTLEVLEWLPPEPLAALEEVFAEPAAAATGEALAPSAVEEILTFDLEESVPAARDLAAGLAKRTERSLPADDAQPASAIPAAARRSRAAAPGPAADRSTATYPAASELYVQELTKLRPGGRTRRLQLLPRQSILSSRGTGLTAAGRNGRELLDRLLCEPLRELAVWLGANQALDEGAALNFSIALPAAALEIDDLPETLAECVRATALAPGSIGIEVPELACVRECERAERLIHTLEQLGCGLVLDDFTFDSSALELLRSKALRLVKVERTLIGAALRDKLAQARIVAISQAARVLGIHCAAKHVDALATQRWLAAAGFDFAEGPLFAGPRPLADIAKQVAD